MKKFLYLVLFLLNYVCYSQVFSTDIQFSPPKYSAETKDTSELVVLFDITVSNGDKKIVTQTLLQVGKEYSKFIDANTIQRDSLIEAHSHLKSVGAKELNELGKYNVTYKKNVLKDFSQHTFFVQERIAKNVYQYQETLPKLDWILTKETKSLLGYNCKSAKLNFRGRNYKAWYTEDIPKNDGPYIFQGLPGLILQITDQTGTFDFTATAIEKKKMNIYWRNEKTVMPISRDDFRKIQRNYFENPTFFSTRKAFDESGKEIKSTLPPKVYNPLELE